MNISNLSKAVEGKAIDEKSQSEFGHAPRGSDIADGEEQLPVVGLVLRGEPDPLGVAEEPEKTPEDSEEKDEGYQNIQDIGALKGPLWGERPFGSLSGGEIIRDGLQSNCRYYQVYPVDNINKKCC